MTANRRILNAAILSTLCALTMSTSARADALTDDRGAAAGLPALAAGKHVPHGQLAPRHGKSAIVTLRFASACD